MDRPRLRPLEAFPLHENGQRLLGLRDPSGLSEAVARLPPAAVAVIQLCDGETTRDEICAEFVRRYQSPLTREVLDKLLDQLDQALLLDSERFRMHSASVFAEFARSPVRPAHLAGKSYPGDPAELGRMLDGFYAQPRGPGGPEGAQKPLPRALIAPHIDFNRGGPAYAWAYRPLAEAATLPELVVVFGTDHTGAEHPFTLTRKHYQTPFGQLETDIQLVDALTAEVRQALGAAAADNLYRDEHHHRGEHSIEFQMVWLRHIWKERADGMKVLPILCGSLHHLIEDGRDPSSDVIVATVLGAIEKLTAGRRTLFIAGADLAHVGPRFGDAEPLDADDRESLERRDQATLAHCASGDATAWFTEIAKEKDRRRVCGLPPIYAMLKVARPGVGQLRAYGQCPADDNGGSLVSIASVV
ncbi:MAG TPA: AmmeMemoRadiSam system protein B, partial [Kofleriaceae bacterium]|nr:AmmeMemoRadiSam system protein B [Kofleriaceae bacterium]